MTLAGRAHVRRLVAAVVAALGLLPVAGTAAAERASEVQGGTVEWGIGTSVLAVDRDLVAVAPAELAEDGRVALEVAGGQVAGTTAELSLAGGIALAGTESELWLAALRVTLDGDRGTLLADATVRDGGGQEPVEHPGLELATLDLADRPNDHPPPVDSPPPADSPLPAESAPPAATCPDGNGTAPVTLLSDAPVHLTADGAEALGGHVPAGTELGPLSLDVEIGTPPRASVVTAHPQDTAVAAGADVSFTAAASGHPAPAVQWQLRGDAADEWHDVPAGTEPELTLPAVAADDDGTQVRAVFRNGCGPDAATDVATLAVTPSDEPVVVPAVEVLAGDGTPLGQEPLTPGDTVLVRGTGFASPTPAEDDGAPAPTSPPGVVVAFGNFAEHWRPSEGAPSVTRAVSAERWVVPEAAAAPLGPGVPDPDPAVLAPDGSFIVELVLTVPEGGWPAEPAYGTAGVYTYAAGDQPVAAHELAVPIDVEPGASFGLGPALELVPAVEPRLPGPTDPPPAVVGTSAEPERAPQPGPRLTLTTPVPQSTAAADAAAPAADRPPEEGPATTEDGSLALIMVVVMVVIGGATVAGMREKG